MLALLVLLALLGVSANASPAVTSTATDLKLVDSWNVTVPTFQHVEFTPCNFEGNEDFERGCYCFSDIGNLYAVDRHWMIEAINGACEHFTGGIGDPVSVYGTLPGLTASYTFTYTYPPIKDTEEGKILIGVAMDRDDPACAGLRPLGWDECWYTLHDPLDDCDTGTENKKHGGVYLHECLYWIVDPAPSHNQPYGFDGLECENCGTGSDAASLGESASASA